MTSAVTSCLSCSSFAGAAAAAAAGDGVTAGADADFSLLSFWISSSCCFSFCCICSNWAFMAFISCCSCSTLGSSADAAVADSARTVPNTKQASPR